MVTHDRWFLDEVCTATWEVHDRLIEPFEGGYAAYISSASNVTGWERRASPSGRTSCARSSPGCAVVHRRARRSRVRMDAAYELIQNEPEPETP